MPKLQLNKNGGGLQQKLLEFTFETSEIYVPWNSKYPNYYISPGVKYLADQANAYWLVNIIAESQTRLLNEKGARFQMWRLRDNMLTCTYDNDNMVWEYKIEERGFPLPEIKLYAEYLGNKLCIMLTNEW